MTDTRQSRGFQLTRREAMSAVAGAGLGVVSALAYAERADAANPVLQTRVGNPPFPSWNTEFRQLRPNVYAYTQAGGPGVPSSAISNGACILGPDHWMAIDAFAAPPHTKAFLAAAKSLAGGRACDRLINTHHHADHTTGNCFFLPAEIVGHEYCREAVIKTGISNLAGRPEAWKVGMAELKLAPPTTTFDDKSRITYRYGSTEVQITYNGSPAHTWGDALVYLPQYKILWAGDIAFFYVAPAAQSGHISKWIESIDRINKMDVNVIVPGHGPIGSKKELAETREYLTTLKTEAKRRYDMKMSPGKAAAEIEEKLGKFSSWTDPAAIRTVNSVVRLYAEFKDTLTPDTDTPTVAAASEEYIAIRGGSGRLR
jgi:cyclase